MLSAQAKANQYEYQQAWRKRNPGNIKVANRRSQLKRRYGLTVEAFAAMMLAQGGYCRICETKIAVAVDHDHDTGRVRGLVCTGCNIKLGWLDRNFTRIMEHVTC